MQDAILDALRKTLSQDPNNLPLRVHFVELLAEARQWQEALAEAQCVLAEKPDDAATLRFAAQACEALGNIVRAESYRRMADALSGTVQKAPEAPKEDPIVLFADAPIGSEIQFQAEDSGLKLQDVAGMADVKRRLNLSFLAPLQKPELAIMYGKSLKGGLLLYGPPGCGKTFIARALAGELGARFLSVGIAEVLDMYLGQSEKNLKALFNAARAQSPCVLFFDEIDALGRKRSLRRESAGRDLVNLLLAEMDGLGADNSGVFILAATNHPWDVDAALRRPGRFDRMAIVLPPDQPSRLALLEKQMIGKPAEKLDLAAIAAKTESFSGADLVHLCDSAVERALEDALKTGVTRALTMADFQAALKEVKPSTQTWFEAARNHALFANESGLYDDLLAYMKSHKML
jgi:SpoVK/Ycf46/Vps4 family AAA+-type ATPase